jgi:hypothetical protein
LGSIRVVVQTDKKADADRQTWDEREQMQIEEQGKMEMQTR